jgi:arylformamidase
VNEWIPLAQPIFEGMPMPAPHGEVTVWVDQFRPRPDGPLVRITHLESATHVGTHVDAAAHFIPDGRFIDQYDPAHFMGRGVVIDVRRDGPVPVLADELEAHAPGIERDDFVFLYVGYAERFRDHSYHDHPYLDHDAALWLVDRGVRMVGIDVMTPDMAGPHRPPDFNWPVHHALLGNDILIIENMGTGLASLLGRRVEVMAVPLPISGADGAPVVPLARPVRS